MKCPTCGFDSPPGMLFCGMCGTRLALVCTNCGFANPASYRFCGMCGTRLPPPTGSGVTVEATVTPVMVTPAMTASLDATESAPLPLPAPELTSQPDTPDDTSVESTPILMEGERRVVTVVVTDMSGSTALLERVGTETWVELMNRILHILEAEVERFGGEVEQFRGDGMVAFFGATEAHEDDPERAVLAALSMQQALSLSADEVTRHGDTSGLRVRVGVNTGEVIIDCSADRRPYSETAMGMAVAVAARMETAAEPGTVLVSEHTYRLAESQFEWQLLGEISIRGISQPITVFRPLAPKADRDGDQADADGIRRLHQLQDFQYSTPSIGRDTEFHTLKHCVEDVLAGRGRIVMLTGDKGLGKSFLVNEMRQYYVHRGALLAEAQPGSEASAPSLTWLRGRCRSYHQGWPYSMWIDLLQNWLNAPQFAPQLQSKEELRDRLREQSKTLWGEELIEHYPYLATLLSLPLEESFSERVRHLDGERLRQRYFLSIHSWVETMSHRGPLVLQFADMQWVGTSSLDLLKYCLPLCDTEQLLYLLVFRSERDQPTWEFSHLVESAYPHRLTHIELTPLNAAQSAELITSLIGHDTLPAQTRDLIIKNAAGNPYYIQELIRSLITSGVLVRERDDADAIRHDHTGKWHMTRSVTTLDLPDNLQRLLLVRIDRLSTEERFVLQIASVIGSVFWSNVVQALVGDMPSLRAHLTTLQRVELIQETGRVPELGMQYLFRAPLIRDAAYDSLLTAQRVTYHSRVAEHLEFNVNSDALVGYYGLLAYHYRGAENYRKELFYTLLAAEQARRIYANAEALQRYARALDLLDRMEAEVRENGSEQRRAILTQRFEVLKGRHEVLFDMGEVEASRTDARALLPLAQEMADDPAWMIDALLAQTDVSPVDSREEVTEGLRMAHEALALAQQLSDRQREMQSLIAVARTSVSLRQPESREAAERALELARQLGDLRAEVNLLIGFSIAYGIDDLPRSQEYLQKALSRSEQLNDKAIEIVLLGEISSQFERNGDYYRQLVEYEQKRLRISREIGNRFVEGDALMYCGQIQALYLGDDESGLALEQEALRKWEPLASKLFPLLRIAQIQTMQRKLVEAQATLETARPISGNILNDLGRAGLGLVTAILYNAIGDEAHLRMALDLTSQVQQMVADNLVSRQYRMAAACVAASTHLMLARLLSNNESTHAERKGHLGALPLQQALEASQTALDLYRDFGFVQIVECTSEEILFRHSQALAANGRAAEAADHLKQAYDEMMRKHDLIPPPPHSPYRRTYLDIALHREIQAAYARQG